MTLVADPSFVLAVLDPEDPGHLRARAFYEASDEELVTTPLAVAELDRAVVDRAGAPGSETLWRDLDSGALLVRWWATAMSETLALARATPDLGLTRASLLALAPVARTTRLATLDPTLSAAQTVGGTPYTLLP